MSLCIVTSAVKVSSKYVTIVDQKNREREYLEGIQQLLACKNLTAIIICDNSMFNYHTDANFRDQCEKSKIRIEVLCFQGDSQKIYEHGKGYGEGEIMKYIFKNSELLKEYDSFYKITGRLYVSNFNQIISASKNKENVFIRTFFSPTVKEYYFKTFFYKMNKNVFNNFFLEAYKDVRDDEGVFLEHIYYNVAIKNNISRKYFNVYPNIIGKSGTTGKNYNDRYYLKNLLNKIYNYVSFLDV